MSEEANKQPTQGTPAAVVVEKADTVTVEKHAQMTPDMKHLESKTTSEEDLHTASQRKVNLVWEYSQAGIAWMIVGTTCLGIFIGRVWVGSTTPFPAEWWTIVGLVIGFYFGRTNHQRVGGVQIGR